MYRPLACLAISLSAAPALAQTAPQPAPLGDAQVGGADASPETEIETGADTTEQDGNEILVVATRLRGQVDTPLPPVTTLDEAQIASYGAGSISELLTAISPQTGSGRGRGSGSPVILLNGQRISSFRELRNFSPEAIKRVEVLQEEVALRFGFPADARVINFILKDNFSSKAVELDYRQPGSGGFSTKEIEATVLTINGPRRFSVTVSASDTTPLTESERNIMFPSTSPPVAVIGLNPQDYRTLVADSRELAANISWATGLGAGSTGGSLSLNGNITQTDSRSGSGLDALLAPLERFNHVTNISGSAGINTVLGDWQFSATADVNHAESTMLIDQYSGAGIDTAISNTERVTTLVTLVGRPLSLPAGEVSTTFKAGYNWSNITSSDTRSMVSGTDLTRGRVTSGFNLALPLTSRREEVLSAVGDITLNFSAGYDHLSDFGALFDWSAGLTWSPTQRLGLQASYIVTEAAPSLSQLGNPETQSFNVPVYDFATGQSVLATVIGGGNPALIKERQRDLKLSANWQLPILTGSNLLVEYFRNRSNDVSASFPVLTPAIETAFPGRVTRDATGRIIAVDQRPVTLAEQTGSRLRWGFNLSGMIGKAPAGGGGRGPGAGTGGGGGPRSGGGGGRRPGAGGPPGMMMGMFGGGGQGRWNLGVYHTVRFSDQVVVAAGGPVLDLLNGDALSGSGVARHSLELEGGGFYKGIGVRMNGRYTGARQLRASGVPGSSDLSFASLTTLDLRMFVDLGQKQALTKLSPFFKGARLALRIDNLFDARQKVTDGTGAVPLSYQPDYLDPRGRFIGLELRKQF